VRRSSGGSVVVVIGCLSEEKVPSLQEPYE
jgi:hypothetical protein